MLRRQSGFTLIELMVVLIIVGILLAVAIPGFSEQLRKSRRADAIRGLSELQLSQERWRSSNATYGTSAAPPAGVGLPTSPHYTFAVVVPAAPENATDVELTATPKAAQLNDRCGTYTLRVDNDNDNAPSGTVDKTTSTAAANCW